MKTQRLIPRVAILSHTLTAAVLLSCAAALTLPSTALAGEGNQGNPGVLPPHSKSHGMGYGEWGAAWWQWALAQPEAVNPLLDATGEFCDAGQSGPVWFLAGTFGGDAERTCTVPAGKALFFPVFNTVFGAAVGDCGGPDCEIEELQASAAAFVDAADILEAEVDGWPIQNLSQYRAASPEAFDITFPAGAVFGLPAGTFGPNVCDGYWLMLAPLPPGEHEIRFRGGISGEDGFEVEVVYHLTVQP